MRSWPIALFLAFIPHILASSLSDCLLLYSKDYCLQLVGEIAQPEPCTESGGVSCSDPSAILPAPVAPAPVHVSQPVITPEQPSLVSCLDVCGSGQTQACSDLRQSIRELAQLAHEQFGLDGVDQELEDTYIVTLHIGPKALQTIQQLNRLPDLSQTGPLVRRLIANASLAAVSALSPGDPIWAMRPLTTSAGLLYGALFPAL